MYFVSPQRKINNLRVDKKKKYILDGPSQTQTRNKEEKTGWRERVEEHDCGGRGEKEHYWGEEKIERDAQRGEMVQDEGRSKVKK